MIEIYIQQGIAKNTEFHKSIGSTMKNSDSTGPPSFLLRTFRVV